MDDIASLVQQTYQANSDAAAELRQTVGEANHEYLNEPFFRLRVTTFRHAMALLGKTITPEQALEYMAALIFVERRTRALDPKPSCSQTEGADRG